MIRQSGSHIVLRHPDGRWTTVPIHRSKDVAKGTFYRAGLETGREFVKNYKFNGLDILVVDDEEIVRKNLKSILKKVGFNVFEAQDGFEAYELNF